MGEKSKSMNEGDQKNERRESEMVDSKSESERERK
jgi:hypothetical protein